MTNNLKEEIDKILDRQREFFVDTHDSIDSGVLDNEQYWAVLKDLRKSQEEAKAHLLTLINQKEKELLGKVERLLIDEPNEYPVYTKPIVRNQLRQELRDRIKQLKEELNNKGN